jgi:hypothetical protein
MALETSVSSYFNQLTRLVAREDFIICSTCLFFGPQPKLWAWHVAKCSTLPLEDQVSPKNKYSILILKFCTIAVIWCVCTFASL